MAILNNSNAISAAGGYDVNNSLRFRSSASAYLNRTQTTTTNSVKCTFSGWVKRGALGTTQVILSGFTGGDADTYIYFDTTNKIRFYSRITNVNGAAAEWFGESAAVYRDPSAWYHIVVVIDTSTSKATNNDYYTVYVNNIAQTFTTVAGANLVSAATVQNRNTNWNVNGTSSQAGAHRTANYLDGYLADVNFIDGQALTPSSFGATDATTGVWQPKAYSGTYGTNGFYLKFSDIATTSGSNAGLGKDFSGNSNYWTTNNISVTSGTTYDAMTDVPTNTSATVANYCVLNPLITGNVIPPTEANLLSSLTSGTNAYFTSSGTIAISSGKWYWECSITARDANAGQWFQFGIVSSTTTYTNNAIGFSGNMSNAYAYYNDGGKAGNGTGTVGYGATFTTGDIIGIAFDADAGTITFYKNNVSQGQAFSGISSSLSWLPVIQIYRSTGTTNTAVINFGQRPFSYTPPTGYLALNTFNLPNPTILQGNKYMDATLYTGNGATRSITNDGSFKPDFVWIKARSISYFHRLADSVRGTGKELYSNDTGAETTNQADGYVSAFNSNGFSILGGAGVNLNANTFVAWQWQAGQGSTSSNTAGSITSTVSVNASAGFSVVTYTGNGTAGATIGHGLGVKPSMIIIKNRSGVYAWPVFHTSIDAATGGNGAYLTLNSTAAKTDTTTGDAETVFGNGTQWVTPTSTVFTIGGWAGVNTNTSNYVAYCWAEIAGFSKFGSYTGNGSTDGPFVYTGFRPKFVMIKRTDSTGSWYMIDTSRATYNVVNPYLLANVSNVEATDLSWDILSNGFKLRSSYIDINTSGATMIYVAFAENPFKNSLAR